MADHKTAEEHVEQWAEESGTALELRVARAFRLASPEVFHARYYVADDGQTLRESDVVAVFRSLRSGTSVSLHFVVECKATSDPWVLFEREEVYGHHDTDIVNTFTTLTYGGYEVTDLKRLYEAPVLFSTERSAYQVADTAKANMVAYGAVRQAMAGVRGLMRDVSDPMAGLLIFIPVVVTTAPLFTLLLSSADQLVAARTNRMLLVSWQGAEAEYKSTWVLHESAVAEFVADVRRSVEAISLF